MTSEENPDARVPEVVVRPVDDDTREVAYDAGAEQAFAQAPDAVWTTISMANDWERVFAHED